MDIPQVLIIFMRVNSATEFRRVKRLFDFDNRCAITWIESGCAGCRSRLWKCDEFDIKHDALVVGLLKAA